MLEWPALPIGLAGPTSYRLNPFIKDAAFSMRHLRDEMLERFIAGVFDAEYQCSLPYEFRHMVGQ
jgi:hypothetical protein